MLLIVIHLFTLRRCFGWSLEDFWGFVCGFFYWIMEDLLMFPERLEVLLGFQCVAGALFHMEDASGSFRMVLQRFFKDRCFDIFKDFYGPFGAL